MNLYSKIWQYGATEPSSWQIQATAIYIAGVNIPLYNGSVGLFVKDAKAYFDDLQVQDITQAPVITPIMPEDGGSYGAGDLNFTINVDKDADWCGYELDNAATNTTMVKVNYTTWNGSESFVTYQDHNVTFYCNDSYGNMGSSGLVEFSISPEYITFFAPIGGIVSDDTPLLNATFNQTCDTA